MTPKRIMSLLARIAVCSLVLLTVPGPAFAKKNSGFLSDYSKLEKTKDPLGVKRSIWTSSALNGANYQKILVEQVSFYPAPEPSKQVSGDVLEEIRAYIDATLRESIGAELPMVDEPGPGVLRLRVAITAVAAKKGLKLHELIPVAMVVAGAKEAAGGRNRDVELSVESELTDSVSKEVLALVVREAKAIKLKGAKDQLTLEDAKPNIDEWGEALRQMIVKMLK
jgi:hypothetical protein